MPAHPCTARPCMTHAASSRHQHIMACGVALRKAAFHGSAMKTSHPSRLVSMVVSIDIVPQLKTFVIHTAILGVRSFATHHHSARSNYKWRSFISSTVGDGPMLYSESKARQAGCMDSSCTREAICLMIVPSLSLYSRAMSTRQHEGRSITCCNQPAFCLRLLD